MSEEIVEEKKKTLERKDYDVPELPRFEFILYFTIWFCFLFKGCYEFYKLCYNKSTMQYFKENGFISNTYFGLYKSSHEYLWEESISLFRASWFPFTSYLLFSKILRSQTSPNTFMIGCSIFAIAINYQYSSLKFLLMEIAIFIIPAIFGMFKSKTLVWISGLAMMYYIRYLAEYPFFHLKYIFSHAFPYVAVLITRSISTGLTIAESPKYDWKLFLEMFFFYWYLPTIIGCRMMTIKDFIAQIYKPFVIENWKNWFFGVLRVLVYIAAWDIISKLIHVHLIVMTHDMKYIHFATILGSQLFYGLHFYMIYVVLYKSVFLVTQLDGFLTTEGPECIAHISLYSRMWRNFDVGLHVWLKDHIYRPVIKLGPFNTTKHFAVLFSFGFVLLFHGIELNNTIWIVINIIQYYLENLLKFAFLHTWFGKFMEKRFSQIFIRRIIGLAGGISFTMSFYAFSVFQFGLESANSIYFNNMKFDFNWLCNRLFFLILFVYSHFQVSLTTNEYLRKHKLKSC